MFIFLISLFFMTIKLQLFFSSFSIVVSYFIQSRILQQICSQFRNAVCTAHVFKTGKLMGTNCCCWTTGHHCALIICQSCWLLTQMLNDSTVIMDKLYRTTNSIFRFSIIATCTDELYSKLVYKYISELHIL